MSGDAGSSKVAYGADADKLIASLVSRVFAPIVTVARLTISCIDPNGISLGVSRRIFLECAFPTQNAYERAHGREQALGRSPVERPPARDSERHRGLLVGARYDMFLHE
jgi:hypothetical protein